MKQKNLRIGIAVAAVVLLVTVVVIVMAYRPDPTPPTAPQTDPTTVETTVHIVREDKLIGVCVPSQTDAWLDAGAQLEDALTAHGYRVIFSWGDGTAEGQATAMRSLIYKGAAALVVAPVDSATLLSATAEAKKYDVAVLSYGSLLMDTDAVVAHICYDYEKMGGAVAEHVAGQLSLDTAATEGRSHTIELFSGAPEDSNALSFHKGLLAGLKPYLDAGVLRAGSGRLAFEDTCVAGWSAEKAAKLSALRLAQYGDAFPDAVICASDAIAAGVVQSLTEKGCPPESWPLITGNGATAEGLAMLDGGKLALTVKTDPNEPIQACAAMVDMVLLGVTPAFHTMDIFNNIIEVPTALCDFTLIHQAP